VAIASSQAAGVSCQATSRAISFVPPIQHHAFRLVELHCRTESQPARDLLRNRRAGITRVTPVVRSDHGSPSLRSVPYTAVAGLHSGVCPGLFAHRPAGYRSGRYGRATGRLCHPMGRPRCARTRIDMATWLDSQPAELFRKGKTQADVCPHTVPPTGHNADRSR
jgi:hypothetical protein